MNWLVSGTGIQPAGKEGLHPDHQDPSAGYPDISGSNSILRSSMKERVQATISVQGQRKPYKSQRLIEAFDFNFSWSGHQPGHTTFYFEPRQPAGLEHFGGLLYACSNRKIVSFCHTKLWEDVLTGRTIASPGFTGIRGRWYLDTKTEKNKTFGLDRITDLDISKTSFREKYDLDPVRMFEHSFGIIINDEGASRIQLQLSFEQGLACCITLTNHWLGQSGGRSCYHRAICQKYRTTSSWNSWSFGEG